MSPDFFPFFAQYEQLLADVDKVFNAVREQHPDCVTCASGCSDCCHALFDLPLIEALYLNHHFHASLPDASKERILAKADQADRSSYKLKYQAYKRQRSGEETEAILEDMARKRVRCPLLNSQERCDLYDYRPITCRLYGIPQEVNATSRTCALSKFSPGVPYPTVHVDKIHKRLAALSMELVASLNTKYKQMGDILVPPSMALLTVYDDEYLGLQNQSGGCSANSVKSDGAPECREGCTCGPNRCDPESCEPCQK